MAIPFLKGIDVTGTVDLSNLTIDGAQGTDGQVLTSTGSGIAWEDASGGASLSGGAANKLAIWSGTDALTNDTNLHWDTTNNRLGIGDSTPSYTLDVNGTIYGSAIRSGRYYGTSGTSSYLDLDSGAPYSLLASSAINVTNSITCNDLEATETTGIAASNGPVYGLRFYGYGNTTFWVDPNDSTTAARLAGGLEIGYGSNGEYRIEVGEGRTGNGYAYIDFVGDTTYSDYGLRLIRNNTGANASSQLIHRGTGILNFKNQEAAHMVFSTSNTERMRITSGGDIGIGTTSPDSMLHLKSTGDVKLILEADSDNSGENDNPLIELKQDNSGIIGRLGMVGDAGQLFTNSRANSTGLGTVYQQDLIFFTENSARVYIKGENGYQGRVGIGTATPSHELHITGTGEASDDFRSQIFYDSNNTAYYANPNGRSNLSTLVIGSTGANSSGYGLDFYGHLHMHNKEINYVGQLHFNDNVRFYDNGDDSYLNYKYGDASTGGIKIVNGSGATKGYIYAEGSGFGLLDNDGHWAVRTQTGSNPLILYTNNNAEFYVYESFTQSPGSSRAPIFYDSDNTVYSLNPGSSSVALNINGKIAQAKEDWNIDGSHSNAIFQATRATQTDRGSWPGSYYYGVNFGDRTKGIQLAAAYSSAKNLYFRSGTDNSGSENGANVWKNWRQLFHDDYHPNADKWTTARTITLAGDLSGSVSIDGSANVTLTASVNDDSHDLTWANIDGETANSVNSWGGLRHQTNDGYIDFGPANTSYAHIYTDRPSFYFNKELRVNNQQVFHTGYHPNADTLTTARTLTIGSTGKTFNGGANVSWTLSEIGAAASSHNHDDRYYTESESNTRYFRRNASNDVDVRIAASHGRGVKFWDSDSYKIYMSSVATGGSIGGSLAGTATSDYNMYFKMSGGTNRGFVFKNAGTNVAQIDSNGHIHTAGHFYGRSVHGQYSNLYRMGGVYFTWDSDSYGTNFNHSITSSYGGTYGDDMTINSYHHLRINIDSNNNNSDEKFEIGNNTTGTGNVRFRVLGTGAVYAANDVVAFYSFSDKRLKTDIKPTTDNLEKILKLKPIEYRWKDGGRDGKKEIGLIAQEVEKIVPEVVRENNRLSDDDETLYKQVDYEHLVSTLIGAVQEQQKQINELKSIINGGS